MTTSCGNLRSAGKMANKGTRSANKRAEERIFYHGMDKEDLNCEEL